MVHKNRKVVCTECRRRRRKCTRTLLSRCLRCERLDRICVPCTNESDDPSVNSLEDQVKQSQRTIQQLETQMRNLSHHSNDSRTMVCHSNNSNIRSVTPTSDIQNNLIHNLMHRWQWQIKNGKFQYETGIRNVTDLLQFQTNISYLSPFTSSVTSSTEGGELGLIINFGSESESLVPFTIKLLTQCAKKNMQRRVTHQLPSSLLMYSAIVMDQLISIYFSCHNTYSPMVHQNSFMEKYRQLQDPMVDLLSLCICCYVCSSPCDHIFFTSMEQRSMSDYFYAKAKSIILDQFDLPEKRLENVMGINLLSKYMHTTLKIKECRRLIVMAYQICVDLKDDFKVWSPDSDVFEVEESVDSILYSRHVTFTLRVRRIMDYISNEIVDDSGFVFPRWSYIDDEPEETKRIVQAQNWLLGLLNHPFIDNFMINENRQIHRIHLGLSCELSFESIIRMEGVITEWSASIPAEFHLCGDLKDMNLCKAAIDKTTDCVLLMSFISMHVFLVSMYSCLLQPIAFGDNNNQLLSIVQEQSLENSLKGCRLLISAVARHSVLAASYFLFHAIDVLMSLSLSPSEYVAKEARIVMKSCLEEGNVIKFMQEHHVPTSSSPFFSGLMDINDASTFNLEYYDQYSQPWFAMTYDYSHYITSLKK